MLMAKLNSMMTERRNIKYIIAVICMVAASCALAVSGNQMDIRVGSGETNLQRYVEYGYRAAVLGDLTQIASYDTVWPDAIPKGSQLRRRIEQHRAKFAEEAGQARALGLEVCLMTDEVSLPIPILNRLQKSPSQAEAKDGIVFTSPEFWKVYRAKYREVLRAYPSVAYVIVRSGENYSHPEEGFAGRTVVDGKIDDAYFTNMQRLIEETRKIVMDEFGRTLIWRTWDLGNNGFHTDARVYDRVLQGLPNRKGLIFSIKHTQTDFWLYNDFNPIIGRGLADQIVEFQCAREYEGKGAFPNYLGPIFATDMNKARDAGVKGVWVWDFGGGWGGPFLKSDRWVRVNIEAASRLAQNPELSPRALAVEWATKEYGPAAATNVAEMLMLSGECVRKFMYIEAFAHQHKGWKPSLNLMRDDIIRGEVLKQLYEGSKKSLPEVFAEKAEAVTLATRMRTLFENSRSDIVARRGEPVYQESLSSLIYMENLAQVMEHYITGMFSFYQWAETRDAATGAKARRELQAWREAWQRYQIDVPNLTGVASIYHSQNRTQNPTDRSPTQGAMAELCEAALQTLNTKTAGSILHGPTATIAP
jgi:hypothetical protein